MYFKHVLCVCCCFMAAAVMWSQDATSSTASPSSAPKIAEKPEDKLIPAGSKLYVAPMPNGFETYVVAGIVNKQTPVVVVTNRDNADFEMTGVSDTERAGWGKMLFMGSDQTNENASIKITNVKSGLVVWAYSVHKSNSVRGKQSAGEACAKHLKEKIESKH